MATVEMKKIQFMWMIGIIALLVVSGCSSGLPGDVSNPKIPSIAKPTDMFFCETDDDCISTIFTENSCCYICSHIVNNDAGAYLKEWQELNCGNQKSREGCPQYECNSLIGKKCENNKCVGISGD